MSASSATRWIENVILGFGAFGVAVAADRLVLSGLPDSLRSGLFFSVVFLATYPLDQRIWAYRVPAWRYWASRVVLVVGFLLVLPRLSS